MATKSNTSSNSFNLSGFVAVDAQIREFANAAVARFPLSVSRTESNGDTKTRKSSLVNVEVWRKSVSSKTFDLLKKGTLVQLSGFIRPEEWTSPDGTKHNRIVFVATTVSKPKAKSDNETATADEPATAESPKGKSSKKAA